MDPNKLLALAFPQVPGPPPAIVTLHDLAAQLERDELATAEDEKSDARKREEDERYNAACHRFGNPPCRVSAVPSPRTAEEAASHIERALRALSALGLPRPTCPTTPTDILAAGPSRVLAGLRSHVLRLLNAPPPGSLPADGLISLADLSLLLGVADKTLANALPARSRPKAVCGVDGAELFHYAALRAAAVACRPAWDANLPASFDEAKLALAARSR
jgi:hypothetical protein